MGRVRKTGGEKQDGHGTWEPQRTSSELGLRVGAYPRAPPTCSRLTLAKWFPGSGVQVTASPLSWRSLGDRTLVGVITPGS